jgi:hypothetical protein
MARTKKFTEIEAKERRKVQTREAVRRTRKKKSEITVLSQGPITLVEEDFLSGTKTVASLNTVVTDKVLEDWETPKISDYVSTRVFDGVKPIDDARLEKLKKSARRALAKGVKDCVEAVLADPRGTLKIDDSIPDAVPADAMTKEQWERAVKAGLIPSEGAEALRDDPVKEEWET